MTAAISNITDWDGMRNYILVKLGMPVNNVELSEEQIDLAIEDTIREYWKYNTGGGNYMDYIIFQTKPGVSEYPVSAIVDVRTSAVFDDIEAIYDFSIREGLDGLNTLFSPQHILLYSEFVDKGNYPGGPGQGEQGGLTLSNYYNAMMYIGSIREAFGKGYKAVWLPGKRILKIIPTPFECVQGVVEVYRRELATNLFNDVSVRKLALAKAKIQWGRNIGKYNGVLPDNLTINYDMILQEGKEEEEKYLQWLRLESEPANFMVG